MGERVPGPARALLDRAGAAVGAFTVTSLAGLCLVVASVGVVAVTAETTQAWGSYFVMEQVIAVATPVVVALLGASLVGLVVTVARI